MAPPTRRYVPPETGRCSHLIYLAGAAASTVPTGAVVDIVCKAKAVALVSGKVHGIRRGDGQVAGHRAGDLVGIVAASAAMAAAAGTAGTLIKEHRMFLLFGVELKVSFRYTLCPQAQRCADYTGRI